MSAGRDVEMVVAAAREVAEAAGAAQQWNYDAVECAALYAVQDAFDRFAALIEQHLLAAPIDEADE